MSYQRERDEFIARMTREGLSLDVTLLLLRSATTLQRYAELACSSEAANRDRVPCPETSWDSRVWAELGLKPKKISGPCVCDFNGEHTSVPRITVLADRLERRVIAAMPADWRINTQGDPRGYVLRVIPPSYAARNAGKDRHNLDSIGVPSSPSRLRF